MTLWDEVKKQAKVAGNAAAVAGKKAKIRAEMILLDNKVVSRKQQFGIDLYDFLHNVHCNNQNMILSDTGMMEHLQPSFIRALKDTKALEAKVRVKNADLEANLAKRSEAFPVPAVEWTGKLQNAGKSASLYGGETKIRTEISLLDSQLTRRKQEFGVGVYDIFVTQEDLHNWLPKDRDVRFLYDQTRRDITNIDDEKDRKSSDLAVLGSETSSSNAEPGY